MSVFVVMQISFDDGAYRDVETLAGAFASLEEARAVPPGTSGRSIMRCDPTPVEWWNCEGDRVNSEDHYVMGADGQWVDALERDPLDCKSGAHIGAVGGHACLRCGTSL